MYTWVIALVAFGASMLTFFSGFGLGTLLTPVFAIFFPVETAVMLTATVHLLNNLFKALLMGRYVNWTVVLKFGITAMLGALVGAYILLYLSGTGTIYTYMLNGQPHQVTLVKLVMALLMIIFALVEIRGKGQTALAGNLPAGGLISGFFGGLSGHQGALRSLFLVKLDMGKEMFIATGIIIACMVDMSRLALYATRPSSFYIAGEMPWKLLAIAVGAAFAGALLGKWWLKKATYYFVQITVTVLIIILALALGSGLI